MKKSEPAYLLGCSALAISGLLATNELTVPAQAAPGPACKPKIEGPLPIAAANPTGIGGDLAPGTIEQEYFISCTGTAGAYKTLIRVRMAQDPSKRSGIVLVEPEGGSIARLTSAYMMRAGNVSIGVYSSPRLTAPMKESNPAKYGSLNLPSGPESGHIVFGGQVYETPTEFEVLAQAGELIKSGGVPGVKARKVILAGVSYFSALVRNYIEWEHPKPGMKSVYDGYFLTQSRKTGYKGPSPDIDVPIMDLEGERELEVMPYAGEPTITFRRPDGPLFRLYEAVAMPHSWSRGKGADAGGAKCVGRTISDYPHAAVFSATLNKLVAWIDKGVAPPSVPWITTSADGRDIKRDQFGNTLGGYRISYVDVPINTYYATWDKYSVMPRVSPGPDAVKAKGPSDQAAMDCDHFGWTEHLSKVQLQKLYSSHDDYVSKVKASLDASVAAGFMLTEDAQDLLQEAQQAKIP